MLDSELRHVHVHSICLYTCARGASIPLRSSNCPIQFPSIRLFVLALPLEAKRLVDPELADQRDGGHDDGDAVAKRTQRPDLSGDVLELADALGNSVCYATRTGTGLRRRKVSLMTSCGLALMNACCVGRIIIMRVGCIARTLVALNMIAFGVEWRCVCYCSYCRECNTIASLVNSQLERTGKSRVA
ncbi:hypothetical protein SNOG_20083, partial [Parastagonospora nodorum SN15]